MNLYRPNNPNKNGYRRLAIAIAVVVIVFSLDIVSGGVIRHYVRTIGAPIENIVSRAIASSRWLSTRSGLESTIRAQAQHIESLQESAAASAVLAQENKELRALVNLVQKSSGVTAPVISSFRTSPYSTFMIAAGSQDGIARGALVLSNAGFVLGRVSDVGVRASLVTALFAPGSSIDALIGTSAGVVEGAGGGNAHAKVARGIDIPVGAAVTAPSLGGKPIGIVGKVEAQSASAYSDIYIGLPVNVASLSFVFVER